MCENMNSAAVKTVIVFSIYPPLQIVCFVFVAANLMIKMMILLRIIRTTFD
jgi:hypothetical protein